MIMDQWNSAASAYERDAKLDQKNPFAPPSALGGGGLSGGYGGGGGSLNPFDDYGGGNSNYNGGGPGGGDAYGVVGNAAGIDPNYNENEGLFSIERVSSDIPKPQQGDLVSFVAANNALLIGTKGGVLIRYDMATDRMQEMLLSRRSEDSIYKVFMDPTGAHALITCGNNSNFYLHRSKQKPVPLAKIKGIRIESVGWNKNCDANSTSEILLGTSNGGIYEADIASSGKELHFKQVFDLKQNVAVNGLQIEFFPPSSFEESTSSGEGGKSSKQKFFVNASTSTRHYQFIGGPTFEAMFANYESNPAFVELPGELTYSELHFFRKYPGERARTCAWLTGVGIYYGTLVFGSQSPGDKVIGDYKLIPYPAEGAVGRPASDDVLGTPPLSLMMTEFHFLLLYPNRIVAVNALSGQMVYKQSFQTSRSRPTSSGQLVQCSRDGKSNSNWFIAENGVFQVVASNEGRNIWKLYLEQGKFAEAMEHTSNVDQEEMVSNAEADYHFSRGSYPIAAEKYALSMTRSFEEIALKFVEVGADDAIMKYLMCKLKAIPAEDKTQRTMICTWLTQIYLKKISALKNNGLNEAYEDMVSDFHNFIYDYAHNFNRNTTLDLLSSYGRIDDLLRYCEVIQDWERVIEHWIQNNAYEEALEVLKEQKNHGILEDIYYKYCPILMHFIPADTVDMLITISELNPVRLIPALMRYRPEEVLSFEDALGMFLDGGPTPRTLTNSVAGTSSRPNSMSRDRGPPGPRKRPLKKPAPKRKGRNAPNSMRESNNHVVRYLEHCVHRRNNKDPAIHNYLIASYSKLPDEDRLIDFIEKSSAGGLDPRFDLKYALRLCHQEGKTRASVKILTLMGLYEEAVKLALTIGTEEAKEVAEVTDPEQKKAIWLLIERHAIEVERNIEKAIEILKNNDCSSIEDILPFFPNEVRIVDFRDEICSTLDEYNHSIEQLKTEMDDYTNSANLIRQDVNDMRNNSTQITTSYKCDICLKRILNHQFCVFPCSHVFHLTCVESHVKEFSKYWRREGRGAEEKSDPATDFLDTGLKATPASTIERLLASPLDECVMCGSLMIESVHQPFITAADAREARSWAI